MSATRDAAARGHSMPTSRVANLLESAEEHHEPT